MTNHNPPGSPPGPPPPGPREFTARRTVAEPDRPAFVPPMEFDPAAAMPAAIQEGEGRHSPADGGVLDPGAVSSAAKPRRGRMRAAKILAGSLAALVAVAIGVDTADLLVRAFDLSPILGGALSGLAALAVGSLAVITGREWRAYARLKRVDHLRLQGALVRAKGGHGGQGGAGPLLARVTALYRGRAEMAAPIARLSTHLPDAVDDRDRLDLAERTLMAPLDQAAYRLVLAASRDVALATALSPAALLDAALVLWRTMKLVREIATLYAARPGLVGSARLVRRMAENIGAAGLADASDTLVTDALGGTLAAALSARLGQGVINGLLTARIGLT
ncbi:MAG: hypothetical protein RLY86_3153, partial [Pseudomonadota bacterium]